MNAKPLIAIDLSQALDMSMHRDSDLIDVTCATEPDPNWMFVDAAGHEHRWSGSVGLPTLKLVTDREGFEYFDEDGYEEYEPAITHYECRHCGAR